MGSSRSQDSNLAWVAPRWPSPPSDGARIAMERLLRPLSKNGLMIDLLSIVGSWEHEPPEIPFELRSTKILKRGISSRRITNYLSAFQGLIGKHPYSLIPFSQKSLRNEVASWVAGLQAKCPIVLDGLHVAASLDPATSARWVYRAHNVEWRILHDASRSWSGMKGRYAMSQALKLKDYERFLVSKAQMTLAVSESDAAELRALAPSARVEVLPIGADFSRSPDFDIGSGPRVRILFVGRLDWEPNRDGLLWFLNHVWPGLDKHKFELEIVGSGDASYLDALLPLQGVLVKGFVKDLRDSYARSDICIAPLRFASGTRVKIVEAIQHGRVVLSTRPGSLGLKLDEKSYFLADGAEDWSKVLKGFDRTQAILKAKQAWSEVSSFYGEDSIATRFQELVLSVTGGVEGNDKF